MAMSDLMVDGIKWDFQASFYSLLNIPVTNKIVDFVGSQITAKTGAPWNRTISLRDLKRKVGLVFRRNKSKFYMPSDKKVLLQKISLRKTRRVTVSYFLKKVIISLIYNCLPFFKNHRKTDVENKFLSTSCLVRR